MTNTDKEGTILSHRRRGEGVVLSLGKEGAIFESPRDIIASVIAFSIVNPGDISSLYKKDLVSFREILTEYSNQPEKVAFVYQEQLKEALVELYPDGDYSVEVMLEEHTEEAIAVNRFIIIVTDVAGNPILNYNNLRTSSDGKLLRQHV